MPARTLTWIDPSNHEQMQWIIYQLQVKGVWSYVTPYGESLEYPALVEKLRRLYREGNRPNAQPEAAKFTLVMKGISGAQQQQRYRNANGRQHSFQLSQEVIKDLKRLAKQRGDSQVQVVRDIITEAAQDQGRIQKLNKAHQQEKAAKQKQHHDETYALRRMLDQALGALAESLHAHSRLEAQVGGTDDTDNEPLDKDTHDAYQKLLGDKIERVNTGITDLKTQRLPGGSLQQRIDKLTPVS